jgi:hypothetical protein
MREPRTDGEVAVELEPLDQSVYGKAVFEGR